MEIITIVLEGELEHKDSMGTGSVISPGEVQVMSAGTGITHSEFNHSQNNEVRFLQIWVFPDKKNVAPRYGQAKFEDEEMSGKWRTVVSPDGAENTLWIHQQAWFSLGTFEADTKISYQLKKADSVVYMFLILGEVTVGGETLISRDGLCLESIDSDITMKTNKQSKILVMEIPD